MNRFERPGRIVVKIGSSSLRSKEGYLDRDTVERLSDEIAGLVSSGTQCVLVSSGAVSAGLSPLGLRQRPEDTAGLQAAASVGQGALIHRYAESFATHGRPVGQILLTPDDVIDRTRYLNARTTFERLLDMGAIPVVNENDSVATDELRFGDNDRLAAVVTSMLDARLLLLLSDVDGLFDRHPADVDAQMIPRVDDIDGLDQRMLGVAGSVFGSGGMASKVEAARIATLSGADVVVAPAGRVGVVSSVVVGEDVGTWFPPGASRPDSRKRWIAFAKMPRGRLRIDAGAVRALVRRGSSLLAAGIIDVTGDFAAGDAAEVVGPDGQTVARGLVAYNAEACRRLRGKSTDELDADHQRAVIHRDSMVVLARPPQPTAGGGTFGTHTV